MFFTISQGERHITSCQLFCTYKGSPATHNASKPNAVVQVVSDPSHAQFILAHGTEAVGRAEGGLTEITLDGFQGLMQACVGSSSGGGGNPPIPMVVANPDIVSGGWELVAKWPIGVFKDLLQCQLFSLIVCRAI